MVGTMLTIKQIIKVSRFMEQTSCPPDGSVFEDAFRGRELLERDADRELLERDAARYRWLRAQNWNDGPLAVVANPKDAVKLGKDCPSLDRLDEAIDIAMEKSKQGSDCCANQPISMLCQRSRCRCNIHDKYSHLTWRIPQSLFMRSPSLPFQCASIAMQPIRHCELLALIAAPCPFAFDGC